MPTPLRIVFVGRRRDEANQPPHGPQGGGGLSVVSPSGSLRAHSLFECFEIGDQVRAIEETIAWASRSIDASPDLMASDFVLAAALVGLGRVVEARGAVRLGLDLNPTFTIARYRASPSSDNPSYLAGLARILDALPKAGAPDGVRVSRRLI